MGGSNDYISGWVEFVYENGLIEDAIHLIATRFEKFDGFRIDDREQLEQIRPDLDIKMAQAVADYLRNNGYEMYIDDYKRRIEGFLFEVKPLRRYSHHSWHRHGTVLVRPGDGSLVCFFYFAISISSSSKYVTIYSSIKFLSTANLTCHTEEFQHVQQNQNIHS